MRIRASFTVLCAREVQLVLFWYSSRSRALTKHVQRKGSCTWDACDEGKGVSENLTEVRWVACRSSDRRFRIESWKYRRLHLDILGLLSCRRRQQEERLEDIRLCNFPFRLKDRSKCINNWTMINAVLVLNLSFRSGSIYCFWNMVYGKNYTALWIFDLHGIVLLSILFSFNRD